MEKNDERYWAIASVLTEAKRGDPDAQCAVGERFWYGDLVRRDRGQAVYWYTQAAMQGYSYAQCCAAYAYATGEGVEKDPVQAVYWYRQAAAQGDAIGIRALAACYAQGFGVKQDYAEAYALACKVIRRAACTPEGFDRP